MDLPLFPLHTVLCPGVALPLHVFEDRYRAMVERCLAQRSPFGVVLIREGREVGAGDVELASVGTVAVIREATRYPDGRFDLLTLGTQRFRLESVEPDVEPYLVGQVTPLREELGEPARAKALGEHVVQLFVRYLELVTVDPNAPGAEAGLPMPPIGLGPDAARQWEVAAELGEAVEPGSAGNPGSGGEGAGAVTPEPIADARPDEEAVAGDGNGERLPDDPLDDVARRLAIPDDPTVLSYLLTGIVQVESNRRQSLLEVPTTELRLVALARLLDREITLLGRGLGAYSPDPRLLALRRN